jgi:3-hydroxyisobutyrate dehydrogenase
MVRGERPDVLLLDAPVSGSREPAERGQLTIFASGPAEARSRVDPLFGALGQRTFWVGEAGAGTRLKLVNNTWLAFANEAVAASVALGRRLGLETTTMVDVLGGSSLVSPWQAAKLRRIADGDFSAQFALSLALKDVHLALQAAGDGRFAVLACLADEWQQAVDQGLGEQDLTVVTRVIGLPDPALSPCGRRAEARPPGRRHHARRVRLPQMLTGFTRMKCAGTPAIHGSSPASMNGTRSASESR